MQYAIIFRYFDRCRHCDTSRIAISISSISQSIMGTASNEFADSNNAPHISHNYCVKIDFLVCGKLSEVSYKLLECSTNTVYNYYYTPILLFTMSTTCFCVPGMHRLRIFQVILSEGKSNVRELPSMYLLAIQLFSVLVYNSL